MRFDRIDYSKLNARQKENFNFQKASGVLADYGFVTLRLSDDWNGADFIALHNAGQAFMVQLKGRLTFDRKYMDKNLWVCFRDGLDWYFYPHDELLAAFLAESTLGETSSWTEVGLYSYNRLSQKVRLMLEQYRLSTADGSADSQFLDPDLASDGV